MLGVVREGEGLVIIALLKKAVQDVCAEIAGMWCYSMVQSLTAIRCSLICNKMVHSS